jgi:iron-sulfur cluster repair protein YtfE (RIC family)
MLVSLGKRPASNSDHPADILLACHARIRGFMATARAIATRDDATADALRESARAVVRYFRVALPRHSADEDESIAPRMKGRDPGVDEVFATVSAEHRGLEATLATMCELLDAIAQNPAGRVTHRDALLALLDELDARWVRHLGLEESVLIPAMRQLATADLDSIRAEMRARRADDFSAEDPIGPRV